MPRPSIAHDSARDGADASGLAVALTMCDSMRTIESTLQSVTGLAERVVIVDSGSQDGSVELARSMGAEVIHRPWAGHVAQKQDAVDRCGSAEWVLLLDSDEALDPRLQSEIRRVISGAPPSVSGYLINRRLVLHGRALRFAFQPEWRLRLFRPTRARLAGTPPHDRVDVDGPASTLSGDLLHDSWASVDDMLRRQLAYARLQAMEWSGQSPGQTGGRLFDVAVRPGAAFLKQYLLKQGFRDGWRGLVASGGAAAAALMKHLAIAEARALRTGSREKRPMS